MWGIVLANAGQCGVLSLRALLRCGRVSRRWWEAVLAALPTLRAVDFRGCETRITGPDVLGVLARVAGANLTAVNLARCRRLGAADVENILACVAATCPRVAAIDVTGCRARSLVRAVAVRARDALAAASPLDLYVLLEALHRAGEEDDAESAGGRCSFGRVCAHLRTLPAPPHLELDPEFDPEENAGDSDWEAAEDAEDAWFSDSEAEDTPGYLDRLLVKEASEGSGWSAALLLGVSFGEDYDGNARMCDCDAHDRSGSHVLHEAAERGDVDMVSLLLRASADVGVLDEDGNTPLLLACRAGHLELAQVLLDKGADASAARHYKGDTPLLAAVAAGNAQLARELAARGANMQASRKDGANVLALALLSKNEACIKLALTQGPKRLEDQDTLDVRASVQPLAEAFLDPARVAAWLQEGASPLVLKGEIGALIATLEVGDADGPTAGMKLQLSHMRALLDSHAVFLKDPPVPLPHAVTQLAAQEPGLVCEGPKDAKDGQPAATYHIIERTNNPARALRFTIEGYRFTIEGGQTVSSLAYSKDGKRLARGEGMEVVVCCAASGLEQCQLSGHSQVVTAVSWSPDGTKLASGSYDKTVRIWDSASGEQLCSLKIDSGVLSVAYSPDGTKLTAGLGYPSNSVLVFDTQTNEQICSLSGEKQINSVAFSPDGSLIAAGDGGDREAGTIRLYNAATGDPFGSPLSGHSKRVYSVAWSPDGAKLASGSRDQTVRIWQAATGKQLSQLMGHTSYVLSVAFHPTKNLLASCCADKTIRTWDITSGSCLSTLRDENASCMSHIFSLAFSPDGQLIAAGEGNPYTSSEAGAVRIYCASTGQVKRALNVGGPVTRNAAAAELRVLRAQVSALRARNAGAAGSRGPGPSSALPVAGTARSGAQKQRVGGYVVSAKGQTLVIHEAPEDKAPEDKVETAADGKAGTETPVAFFQCASNIEAFDVAGANVVVGCADQVLQLRAAVLLT